MKIIKAIPKTHLDLTVDMLPEKYRSDEAIISMGVDVIEFYVNNTAELVRRIPQRDDHGQANIALLTEHEYWELYSFFDVIGVYEKSDPPVQRPPRKIEVTGLSDFLKVMRLTLEARQERSEVSMTVEGSGSPMPIDWDTIVGSDGYVELEGSPDTNLRKVEAIKLHRSVFGTALMESKKAIEGGFRGRLPQEEVSTRIREFKEFGVSLWPVKRTEFTTKAK